MANSTQRDFGKFVMLESGSYGEIFKDIQTGSGIVPTLKSLEDMDISVDNGTYRVIVER